MGANLVEAAAAIRAAELAAVKRNWGWFFFLGLISLIVGLIAMSSKFIATIASVKVIGFLLLIAGATEVVHALVGRSGRGFALHLLAAALYLFVGVFIIEDPIKAAEVITLVMAASFFVSGVLRVIFALADRFPAWPWVLLNGIVNLALGVMIFNRWPEASLWVIGLFVGIDLVIHGWTWMLLALGAKNMPSQV